MDDKVGEQVEDLGLHVHGFPVEAELAGVDVQLCRADLVQLGGSVV